MVFRIHKTKDYTVMSNYHLRDKNLSLKAKGLLSWMLSNDDDWDYSLSGIVACCKEGETTVNTALRELQQYGYVEIIKQKPNSENNRIHYDYNVYERPQGVESLVLESQGVESLALESQVLENPVQRNIKERNTNIINKKERNTKEKEVKSASSFLKHSKQDTFKIDSLVDLYNSTCTKLPKLRAMTDKRKSSAEKIYKKYGLDTIKEVFEIANKSSFLVGDNDRNWKASFDFIMREDKFISILEGKYNGYSKRESKFADEGLRTCLNTNRKKEIRLNARKSY